jgi:hypothetical protein
MLSPHAQSLAMDIKTIQDNGEWNDERDRTERKRLNEELAVQEICEGEYWEILKLFSMPR